MPVAIIQWHACLCTDLNNPAVPMDTGYQRANIPQLWGWAPLPRW